MTNATTEGSSPIGGRGGARSPEVGIAPEAYARYRWVVDRLRPTPVGRLLDVGCGYGFGADYLWTQGIAKEILGIDTDESAIRYALAGYARPHVEFRVGELTELPAGTFNVVLALEVLEHVNQPARLLSEIYRVLTVNGVLLLSTPNRTFTERFYIGGKSENPFHVREYTPPEVEVMLHSQFAECSCFAQESPDSYYQYSESCWVPQSVRRRMPLFARRAWMKLRRKGDFAPAAAIRFSPTSVERFPAGATNQLWRSVKRRP